VIDAKRLSLYTHLGMVPLHIAVAVHQRDSWKDVVAGQRSAARTVLHPIHGTAFVMVGKAYLAA
jgi:hypothetical protein